LYSESFQGLKTPGRGLQGLFPDQGKLVEQGRKSLHGARKGKTVSDTLTEERLEKDSPLAGGKEDTKGGKETKELLR